MKFLKCTSLLLALICFLAACSNTPPDATEILLQDSEISVNGKAATTEKTAAVYIAQDIVYYEDGKDFTYGEGSPEDAHTGQEAAAHTVVHITQPGTYHLRGKLSLGQIAVDLGEDAKKDPNAVVTLVLNGVDITCEVAPAVIFYNVYECGSDDSTQATKDVDTSAAGANVIIADGSENTISGAYVARIYDPNSVILNAEQTEVEDAKKLHKYDGAFYSKMSMNIGGGDKSTGVLNIYAQNEGLDSEMHLTLNGGIINIRSGNDGINTNEDGISVTTVNGGNLNILVTGETGEGDGIDSNGWLVINGGSVTAAACANSADAGIDSDMGIHINGGIVLATGHMLDRIEDGGQNYAVFQFAQTQTGNETITLKDPSNKILFEHCPQNAYSILVYSNPDLTEDIYTLWKDGTQLSGQSNAMAGSPGMFPGGMTPPDDMELPEGKEPRQDFPGGQIPPNGNKPGENIVPPEGFTPPDMGDSPEMPGGHRSETPEVNNNAPQNNSTEFPIQEGGNTFSNIH